MLLVCQFSGGLWGQDNDGDVAGSLRTKENVLRPLPRELFLAHL